MLEFNDATDACYEPALNSIGYQFLNADVSDPQQSAHTLKNLDTILRSPPFFDRAVVFVTADFPRNKLRRQIDKSTAAKKARAEKKELAQNNDVVVEDSTKEGVVFPYDRCDDEDVKEMLRQTEKVARLADKHNQLVWQCGKQRRLTENPHKSPRRYGVRSYLKTDVTAAGNVKSLAVCDFVACPVTVLVSILW